MSSSNKLSPMASYYVRRLLQSHKNLPHTITDSAASDLTLLEPEEILHRVVANPSERLQRVSSLEILARAYQNLTTDGRHPEQLKQVERQVLQLLGFSDAETLGAKQASELTAAPLETAIRKEFTIAKSVEILQALLKSGERYLGPRIARDYFVGSCPESLQLKGFEFTEDHQLKVSRAMTDTLQGQEAEDLKAWIKLYLSRCSSIINGFDALVDQDHLAYCSITREKIEYSE
jgi:hypothetical protein